jgi:hypothetical protein
MGHFIEKARKLTTVKIFTSEMYPFYGADVFESCKRGNENLMNEIKTTNTMLKFWASKPIPLIVSVMSVILNSDARKRKTF